MKNILRRPLLIAGAFAVCLSILLGIWRPQADSLDKGPIRSATIAGEIIYRYQKDGRMIYLLRLREAEVGSAKRMSKAAVQPAQRMSETAVQPAQRMSETAEQPAQGASEAGIDAARLGRRVRVYLDKMDAYTFGSDGRDERKKEEDDAVTIGSTIACRGTFLFYEGARNPGEFSQRDYHLAMEERGFLICDQVDVVKARAPGVREAILHLRDLWGQWIESLFPREEAALMKSMLLGDQTMLDARTKDLFRDGGVYHLLAISGLHLTILGMALFEGMTKAGIPEKGSAPLTQVILLAYIYMCGMSPSMIRAFLMLSMRLLARLFGRSFDIGSALGLSAVIQLIAHPYLTLHAGFVFSYSSVFFLGVVLADTNDPTWKKMLLFQLAMVPVVLFEQFRIPLYSALLNLLLVPMMEVVLGGGFLTLSAATCMPGLAPLAAVFPRVLLRLYLAVVTNAQRLPLAVWTLGRIGLGAALLFYVAFALLYHEKRQGRGRMVALVFLLALRSLAAPVGAEIQVTMVDVGQGDGIVVETAAHRAIVIDGGSSSKKDLATYTLKPYLFSQGIDVIDYWFVTHGDEDHLSGLREILSSPGGGGIMIKTLVLPARFERDGTLETLAETALERGIRVLYIRAGDQIGIGAGTHRVGRRKDDASTETPSDAIRLTCLHPTSDAKISGHNSESLVLLLSYGSFQMLLTGDLEEAQEDAALRSLKEYAGEETSTIEVLKVAHHGSKTGTSARFLDAVDPDVALISCGVNNSYGHPHEEVLERLKEREVRVESTAESGAVMIRTDGRSMRIQRYLKD